MRTPARELCRVAEFIGLRDVRDDHIAAAVEHASFANMRAREGARPADGTRFAAGRADDAESFKTRRGEVGRYRAYLTPAQVAWLDALIRDEMDPWYGYDSATIAN
jgi:hypothetical protein